MIGFLFGCAAGLAVGCVLGALAAAIFEVKMERDVDRILKMPEPSWPDPEEYITARDPRGNLVAMGNAAGVKVCSCIGALRGPHFVDPECPFHGGAA